MDLNGRPMADRATGAARRRERRLRSWWRHERMSIACALAEALHHSSGTKPSTCDTRVVEGVTNDALRGQNTVTRAREVEERELHGAPLRQKPPPPGTRPAPLVEVPPQTGYERHCGSGFELVLDVTVLQLGRELVEVPNVVSQVVEQNVHIPVHGGPAPVVESSSPASAVLPAPAPVLEIIAPVPAVIHSATSGVDIAPASTVFQASSPVVEHIAPAPAVSESPAPAPAVFQAPAPVVEYFSPTPAVSHASAPVVGYFSLAPAVFPSPVQVVDDFSSAPAVLAESTVPDVEQDTVEEEEEEEEEEEYDQPVVYYSGFCDFLDMEDFRWHPPRRRHLSAAAQLRGRKVLPVLAERAVVGGGLHLWTRASTWSERSVLAVAQPQVC